MNKLEFMIGDTIASIQEVPGKITQITFEGGGFILIDTPETVITSEDLGVETLVESELKTPEPEPEKVEEEEEEKEEPKNVVEPEETQDDELEPWTAEDIEEMDKAELEELIDDEELDIDESKFKTLKKLRNAILEELGLDED